MRQAGADLLAIRLDSGDMASLSIKARNMLDEAGFTQTEILASNSLDEYLIAELKQKGAKISSWGVGTHLTTAYDQPALDGVYKLSALHDKNKKWEYKIKLSEDAIKTSNPGRHQVRRFFCAEQYVIDIIYDLDLGITDTPEAYLLDKGLQAKRLDDYDAFVDLLIPIFRQGKLIQQPTSIHTLRKNALQATTEFYNAHQETFYPVGLEKKLFELKQQLVDLLKK